MRQAIVLIVLLSSAAFCGEKKPWTADSVLDPRFTGTVMESGAAPRAGSLNKQTFGVPISQHGTGVLHTSDGIMLADALYLDGDDQTLWLEAEAAEQIDGSPGAQSKQVVESKDCAGGKFVAGPNFISIPFRTAKAGLRSVWARVCERSDGDTALAAGLIPGRHYVALKAEQGKKDKWRWIRLGDVWTQAGDNRFAVKFYASSIDLDRVGILPPKAEAPTTLEPSSKTMRCETGSIETESVLPPAIKSVLGASVDGGAQKVDFSADDGKTWSDAAALTITPASKLRIKLTLQRDAAGKSPLIKAADLEVAPDPAAWLVLENDFLRVILDGKTGRLFRFTDLKNKRELLWPTAPEGLFEIDLKKRGESNWLRFSDSQVIPVKGLPEQREEAQALAANQAPPEEFVRATGLATAAPAKFVEAKLDGDSIALKYLVAEKVELTARIKLDKTAQSLWTVELKNNHPHLDVLRVQFPRLPQARLGQSGYDDTLLRVQTFGHSTIAPALEPLRDEKYPGGVVLPWQTLYDATGGLSVTARDADGTNVRFESVREWSFRDTFTIAMRKFDNVPAKNGKAKWEYAVAAHPGQWHWAADRYREWAGVFFKRPKYPAWFQQHDGFAAAQLQLYGTRFKDLGKHIRDAHKTGLNQIQFWGQFAEMGGNCCGPFWQPSPRYGTLAELQQGLQDLRRAGIRSGFYFYYEMLEPYSVEGSHIYGRIPRSEYPPNTEFPTHEFFNRHQWVGEWDGQPRAYPLSAERWKEYNRQVAAFLQRSPGATPPTGEIRVDVTHPDWAEYMRHWALDKYVGEWGADGLYYDVLGTGDVYEFFDLRKGQHGHGNLGQARTNIARTTVDSARERGLKDFFLLMEGMCDLPGQYAAPMISGLYAPRTPPIPPNFSEPVRYTWPDMVMFEGHSNSGFEYPLMSLETAYLNGNRFDTSLFSNTVGNLIASRAAVRDWIYRARFMDTVGVNSSIPARLFLRRDDNARGAAVTLLNPTRQAATVRLEAARVGNLRNAIAIDGQRDLTAIALRRDGDAFTFDAPRRNVATVVCAEDIEAKQQLLATVKLNHSPAGPRLIVQIGTLSDPIRGTIVLRDTGPLTAAQQEIPFTVEPMMTSITYIPVKLPEYGPDFVRVKLQLKTAAGTQDIEAPVYNLFGDGSFEAGGNDEKEFQHGRKSLRLDPAAHYFYHMFPLNLEPNRRYRVSLSYKRTTGKDQMSFGLLWHQRDNLNDAAKVVLPFTKDGEWARTEAIINTEARFAATYLYIYNVRSERTLWVDKIDVEDLGAAE